MFCFAAVVTLLVNDATTKEQRNTTVAVLGKGSSFGVWILTPFFVNFELNKSGRTILNRVSKVKTKVVTFWPITADANSAMNQSA